jgi:tripartite-type tricarboxylate transporter receptor subunit TctC
MSDHKRIFCLSKAFKPFSKAVIAAAAIAMLPAGLARAADYPNHAITMIVGFAPGGFVDTLARMVALKLSERLKQNVIVENRAGAGGNLAHRLVAEAKPDGYTILAASTSIAINDQLYKNKGYDTQAFTAVSIAASTPEILANNPQRPEKNLKDVVATARAKGINFGTAGAGSGSFIAAEYFFRHLAKVPAQHIPFQGGAPAITAALGNQIDLLAVAMAGGVAQPIKRGLLRGIASASEKRVEGLEDTPTYAEMGYPGFVVTSWTGYFVNAKTDPAIVAKLNQEINAIMKDPAIVAKIKPIGFTPIYGTKDDAQKMFEDEVKKWGTMVNTIGVSIGK